MKMNHFFELEYLERICTKLGSLADVKKLAEIYTSDFKFPVYGIVMGSKDFNAPALGLFAGVHGLEKIGSHVLLNFLDIFADQMQWDSATQELMSKIRIASIPIVNPGGMYLNWRSNPNGVDIMRNAPFDTEAAGTQLVSGHRLTSLLPWYRGVPNGHMERETQALVDFVEAQLCSSPFSLSLDLHSGFGMIDRLWYPYSKTRSPFPLENIAQKVTDLLNKNVPQHIYRIEPQSSSYLIQGDPWDYLFDKVYRPDGNVFIPYALEMGSWLWIRKNPRQLFSTLGLFNPVKHHRYNRIMRRHRPLLEFFIRAVSNHRKWLTAD